MGVRIYRQSRMKVICLLLLVAVAVQAENCQVYKNGIENIFSKLPAVKSESEPNDGVCEDGEGWGCIAEIATTVMTASPRSGWTPRVSRSVSRRQLEQPATAGIACAGSWSPLVSDAQLHKKTRPLKKMHNMTHTPPPPSMPISPSPARNPLRL